MNICKMATKLLLVVGALNWGLVGFFKYNLVAEVFGGEFEPASRVVFALVGLAGLSALYCCARTCCRPTSCGPTSSSCSTSSCGCDCGCKTCCKDRQLNK